LYQTIHPEMTLDLTNKKYEGTKWKTAYT
jgi:hypothetical protein